MRDASPRKEPNVAVRLAEHGSALNPRFAQLESRCADGADTSPPFARGEFAAEQDGDADGITLAKDTMLVWHCETDLRATMREDPTDPEILIDAEVLVVLASETRPELLARALAVRAECRAHARRWPPRPRDACGER